MANPLINKIAGQISMPMPANNPMGSMAQMMQQFQQFRQLMVGRNPQQIINNLMASGQMTNEQYQQLVSQAKNMMQMFR